LFYKGEGYRILVSPKETLGAVNGIQRPEPSVGSTQRHPAINGLKSPGFIDVGIEERHKTEHRVFEACVLNLSQQMGIFFAYERILGEGLFQKSADHGLGPEIRDRYGRAVLFCDDTTCNMGVLNGLTEFAGFENRLHSNVPLFFIINHG
jgi:hypothetical protein